MKSFFFRVTRHFLIWLVLKSVSVFPTTPSFQKSVILYSYQLLFFIVSIGSYCIVYCRSSFIYTGKINIYYI